MSTLPSTHSASTAVPIYHSSQSYIRRHQWIWIVLLWAVVYIPGMFSPPLMDDADSIHAEAAREMTVRHDWSTLYIDGVRYLEKAPLMYWGMATGYTLFGPKDWAARLPLALGVLALLLATYSLGKRTLGERAGFWAAVILTVSVGPYIFTRFLIPEMLVGLWLTLGFDFFLRTLQQEPPSRSSCWGLAATAGLDVLTKGLIGIVFPAAVIFLFLLLTGRLKHLLRMRLVSSTLILLAIAAPWHIWAAIKNPAAGSSRGFLWFYFVNEHFLRYLGKRIPKDYDTVPLAIFWGLMLVWLFPWAAFLFQALRRVPHRWSQLRSRMTPRQDALLLYAIWAAVILVFFSFSTRQEYYTIPALPGLALLVGGWLQQEDESAADSRMRRNGRIGSAVLFGLACVALAATAFLLWSSKATPPGSDLAELLKKNPDEYRLSFGHIFDLTPRALGLFRVPLVIFSMSLFVGTLLNLLYRKRRFANAGNWVLTVMMVLVLFAVHQAFVMFSPILSSKRLADAIAQEYRPGDVIVVNGSYDKASTLNFYLRRPIHLVNSRTVSNMYYGALFPDVPNIFEDDASVRALWNGPGRVFLWVSEDNIPSYAARDHSYELARSGGKMILMNRAFPQKQ